MILNHKTILSFLPILLLLLLSSSTTAQPLALASISKREISPHFALHEAFLPRQGSSDPVTVNLNSTGTNGGSDSAEESAQEAGSTVDTGQGGSRATPTSVAGFSKLLSGAFFGTILTVFAAGCLLVQTWHYFERFGARNSDQLAIQILVGCLIILSLAQTAALIHRITEIHVINFGDFLFPLLSIGNEIGFTYITTGLMIAGVQCFYLHRCWVAFKRSIVVLVGVGSLIFFIATGGIASGVLVLRAGSAANVKGSALASSLSNSTGYEWSVVFATWLCCAAAVDFTLCIMLCYSLQQMKSPFWHTRYAIWRLFLLSVETCLVTSSFSLVTMILFLTSPEAFNYLITLLPIGTIHASSLLVTLMSRPSIAKELAQDQIVQGAGGQPTLADDVLKSAVVDNAPSSLAKPLIKRMMKSKRPKPVGDLGGIGVVTTIHQEENDTDGVHFEMTEKHEMDDKADDRSISHKSSHPGAFSEGSWDDSAGASESARPSHSGDDPSSPPPTQTSFVPSSKPRSIFSSKAQQVLGANGDNEMVNGIPSSHPYALFEPAPFASSNMGSTVEAAVLAHSGMKSEANQQVLKEAQKAVKAAGASEVQPLKSQKTQKVTIAPGQVNPRACPWDA